MEERQEVQVLEAILECAAGPCLKQERRQQTDPRNCVHHRLLTCKGPSLLCPVDSGCMSPVASLTVVFQVFILSDLTFLTLSDFYSTSSFVLNMLCSQIFLKLILIFIPGCIFKSDLIFLTGGNISIF